MSGNDIQNLLKSGVEAARAGNKTVAKAIFEQVIQLDSQNEMAWMWLASVSATAAERQRALQRVLNINPNNERAKQAMAKLGITPPPAAPPIQETKVAIEPRATAEFTPPVSVPPESAPLQEATPEPRKRQSRSGFTTIIALLAFITLILAGVIAILMANGFFDEEAAPTATAVSQRPTILATLEPPSPTPPPAIVTRIPGSEIGLNELPPTWTPSPTVTQLPTDTPTPLPPDPSGFEIIFSMQENPAALPNLQRIKGDGSDLAELEINLIASDLSFGQPTPVSGEIGSITPDELSTDATAEAEVVEEVPASNNNFDDFEFIDPAWSPDGEFIAFTAQISPTVQEIFVLNLQNNRVRQLTQLGAGITDGAAWSPDGKSIVFSSNLRSEDATAERIFDLYVITVDSGEYINLTNGAGQNREPVWAPDGQSIIFSSDRNTPNELEIWALPINSVTPTQLTNNSGSSFSPAISHNGQWIAFISNRSGDNDLYIMNADGTSEQLISNNDNEADERDPAWSADDNWLVVSSTREGSRVLQLWVVSPDGRDWRQITDGLGGSRFANWQPNASEE